MQDPKNRQKILHLGTIAQLCRAISSQLRHISTNGKQMLNSNVSSTCTHNMANFGPLTAEIGWRIWSTPSKFQRVSSVGFVTAATSFTGGQPNFARRLAVSWAGTLYIHFQPAGRPSRWASAHIVGLIFNPRDQSKVPGSFWVHVSDGSWPTPLTRDPSSYDDPFDP